MTRRSDLFPLAIFATTMFACNSEILQKQAEQIKQQELEIAQQRKDLEAMLTNQQLQDQKQQDCNRAFRDYFEKAQIASAGDQAIALYREGDRLKQQCEARLQAAQARIEQIQFGRDGAPSGTAPFGGD